MFIYFKFDDLNRTVSEILYRNHTCRELRVKKQTGCGFIESMGIYTPAIPAWPTPYSLLVPLYNLWWKLLLLEL